MIVAPIDHNEDPQTGHFEASAMSDQIEFADLADTSTREEIPISCIELPITVKDAVRFLAGCGKNKLGRGCQNIIV